MTLRNILTSLFLIVLFGCSTKKNKFTQSDNLNVENDTISADSMEFIKAWGEFSNAIVNNDTEQFKRLSTDCIYCTFCVTDTEVKDSIFTDFQNKNEKIWYDKLYNELSYIPISKFLAEDYKLIFDNNITKRINDKSKIIFLNKGPDTLINIHPCFKDEFKNRFPNLREVLVTRIDPSSDYEGAQIALDFILTKYGYKFYSFSTIP